MKCTTKAISLSHDFWSTLYLYFLMCCGEKQLPKAGLPVNVMSWSVFCHRLFALAA